MSTTVTDRHGDTTTVTPYDFRTQEPGIELLSDDKDMFFNVPEAVQLADAIYDAAGVKRSDGVRASDITPNEALIRVAAAHDLYVTFSYSKSDTSPIEFRRLKPESIKASNDGNVLFTGHDPFRDDSIRSFRVDRIKGFIKVSA